MITNGAPSAKKLVPLSLKFNHTYMFLKGYPLEAKTEPKNWNEILIWFVDQEIDRIIHLTKLENQPVTLLANRITFSYFETKN